MILQTERMILRPFADDDLETLIALFQNEHFARYSGRKFFSRDDTAAILQKFLRWGVNNEPAPFALIDRTSERLFGYCGFLHQEVDGTQEIEIGYRLHPEFLESRPGDRSGPRRVHHAFRDLRLERVISLIMPENKASRRVAEKNEMRVEKKAVFKGFPVLVFVLTRAEWLRCAPNRGA